LLRDKRMVGEDALKQLKKEGIVLEGLNYPKHIAFSFGNHAVWAGKSGKTLVDAYDQMFSKLRTALELQVTYDIPITTVFLLTSKVKQSDHFDALMDLLADFFERLAGDSLVRKSKVKISVLGKWYHLPSRVIDPIKKVLDETRDYDSFFLNLCINYDGQEELVDACKLILRRALADKVDVDVIDKEMIKENIYSSYFLPPDLLIKMSAQKSLNGFLLWDSTRSIIYFSDEFWQDLNEKEFLKAVKYYQTNRCSG